MLKQCSKALLLTSVENFGKLYKQLASELNVDLRTEAEWNERYRINEEVVICGTKYADKINKAYYPITVLLLKSGESFMPYVKMGFTRFIFDHENQYELAFALMKTEKTAEQADLKNIVNTSEVTSFQQGDYQFLFDKNKYLYKGKAIYLTDSAKKYLAEWLLNGHKDNSKRMIICNLRKKFGAEFLKDIDRFGQIKEKKK